MSDLSFNPKNYSIKVRCVSSDVIPYIQKLRFSSFEYVKTVFSEHTEEHNYSEVILTNITGINYNVSIESYNIINGVKKSHGDQDISCVFTDNEYYLGTNDIYFIIHFNTPIPLGLLNYLTFKLISNEEPYNGEVTVDQVDEIIYTYSISDYTYGLNVVLFKDIVKHKIYPDEIETFLSTFNQNENESLSIPIVGNNDNKNDVFTIKFSNIRLGQTIQTENIEIEGCVFVKDVELHDGIRGYKVFKDLTTNKEVKLDFYTDNGISHAIDEHILNNYSYLINHTDYDSLNISCKVYQDGVDLTGRDIIYNQTLTADKCYEIEISTLYNGFLQSSTNKKISSWRYEIPSQYDTGVKYTIAIILTSDTPKSLSLYNGSFPYLEFGRVLASSPAIVDNNEVIQFINTQGLQNSNITCELYESSKRPYTWLSNLTDRYGASYLFNPATINNNGEMQTISDYDQTKFIYIMTFKNKLNKEIIKGFKVGIGYSINDYECNAEFKLYDQIGNKLLYETSIYNNTRELITPFKNYE